jgi:hypothetical protein
MDSANARVWLRRHLFEHPGLPDIVGHHKDHWPGDVLEPTQGQAVGPGLEVIPDTLDESRLALQLPECLLRSLAAAEALEML